MDIPITNPSPAAIAMSLSHHIAWFLKYTSEGKWPVFFKKKFLLIILSYFVVAINTPFQSSSSGCVFINSHRSIHIV
jgi:hypothetical protein